MENVPVEGPEGCWLRNWVCNVLVIRPADMQKPRLIGRGFCNKKRGEEKMKKENNLFI